MAFLPRSKRLLISWLQSPSAVIFGAQENKVCHCFHFSLSICHEVMGFSVVNEAQADIFPELPRFLHDPTNVGNLIFGSSAFSKPRLSIRKFSVHILLKPSLKDFEHKLASM